MPEEVRVLCMEDNEGTARLLQRRLSRASYTVDVASSGEAGLEQCASRHYDAILVDYHLPGMNGIQVLQQLAARDTMPPTIVLTGSGNERIAVEALKLGAFDYIVKDIDGVYFDLLPTIIEQALKNQRLLEDKLRAESALRESEKRFRSVIEQSHDGISLFDQGGEMVEWNQAAESISGIRREDVLGRHVGDIICRMMPPESLPEGFSQSLREMMADLPRGKDLPWFNQVFEYEMVRVDGQRRTVQVSRFPIDLGNRVLVGEVTRDVTDRRAMENALRESEERFRMLFEEAPDPYFVSDLEGNLVDCNRAVGPLLGLDPRTMIGKNYEHLPLLAPGQAEKFPEIAQGGYTGAVEITLIRSDGKPVVVDIRMIPIQMAGQTRLLGIAHDITWRKQAEAEMRAHIEQLATLHRIDEELTRRLNTQYVQALALDNMMRLSGADVGSIAFFGEGNVQGIHSVGYPEKLNQLYGQTSRSIVARAVRERRAEWVQDVSKDPDYFPIVPETRSQIAIPLLSQERVVGMVSLETSRPEQFNAKLFEFLKLVATRIAAAVDNAQLHDSTQRQLSELRELYEQVRTLERLKTDMVRIVSHDLNNPLSVVVTSAYLLERSLGSSITKDQQHHIGQINRATKQMKALTTDVLSLENIEQHAGGADGAEKVNLIELIRDIVEICRTNAERKNQKMSFSSPESPVVVSGNKSELQQAASNLIDNAIKYTPEGGQIDVAVKCQDGIMRFEVVDSGYGVPEAAQSKLFQPFERVKTEETKSIEGTGLGLYIVKKIVERNGGEIVFASEHGEGSLFGFTLPLLSQ